MKKHRRTSRESLGSNICEIHLQNDAAIFINNDEDGCSYQIKNMESSIGIFVKQARMYQHC